MLVLVEIDRALSEFEVPVTRTDEARERALSARPASLAAVDTELEELARGTGVPRPAQQPATPPTTRVATPVVAAKPAAAPTAPAPATVLPAPAPSSAVKPGSGLIEVSEEVLRAAVLPSVLSLDGLDSVVEPEPAPHAALAGALDALSIDVDPDTAAIASDVRQRGEGLKASEATPLSTLPALDDPNADLGDLLGDADPLRADAPAAAEVEELAEDHTAMFTAADAERFSRPPPEASGDELDLEMEEVVIDDEPAPRAVAGRTQPPPPPRTMPPEPPKGGRSEAPARGFLGKLLQRKP